MKRRVELFGFFLFLLCTALYAQNKGRVYGKIMDDSNGEPLPYATVLIEGTTMGTTADGSGKYDLLGIPIGSQKLVFQFIGFEAKTVSIEVVAGQPLELNTSLMLGAVMTEEVVVTGQLLGQAAAINQQINANTIVNVVSQDKIRELPDQNAAEAVGRLSGVAIQRDGGEGQKVVLRGLSPRLNSITINGINLPSTDIEDRSVDLSMLSSDMLEGIEFFKALRPDMDGDAVGGRINFNIRKASDEFTANGRLQYGYNSHVNEWGQYRGNFSVSNRFFGKQLGIIASANYQKADRSSDDLGIGYERDETIEVEGETLFDWKINNVNLAQNRETRLRYGGSLVLDYKLGNNGTIALNNILSFTDREDVRRRTRYRIGTGRKEYDLRDREINTSMITSILSTDYTFSNNWNLSTNVSRSYTQQDVPFQHTGRFREQSAFSGEFSDADLKEVDRIIAKAKNELDETWFKDSFLDTDGAETTNYSAQVDLKIPVNVSQSINGYFKFGGKYRREERERDVNRDWTNSFGTDQIGEENPDLFDLDVNERILLSNFLTDYDDNDYLDGAYQFSIVDNNQIHLDRSKLNQFAVDFADRYIPDERVDLGDYKTQDQIYATYLMADFNLWNKLKFVGGVRWEMTDLAYTGTIVNSGSDDDEGEEIRLFSKDSSRSRSYHELLPMFQVKYQALKWLDVRAAVTKTLNRPNFFNLVPWVRIDPNGFLVERGNFDLAHSTVLNYDLFISAYNDLGLFTVGLFYKDMSNIDFIRRGLIFDDTVPYDGYVEITPTNSETTIVQGIELDLQTNLRWLPSPFDGVIIGANATFIDTTTDYPFVRISEDLPIRPIFSSREGALVGQADVTYNFSLGYEKGGFSARASLQIQDRVLGRSSNSGVNDRPGGYREEIGPTAQFDKYSELSRRLDIALNQRITDRIKIFINGNNLTNQPEQNSNGFNQLEQDREFGATYDIGLQAKF